MDFYQRLAKELLKLKNFTYFKTKHGTFGFKYMRNYSGKMAEPKVRCKIRRKLGYFDIQILTGVQYGKKVTHRAIIEDILRHSNKRNCLAVWKGNDPRRIGKTQDEKEALATFGLLMFEQEVNWGNEEWQRNSNFNPDEACPTFIRPRDMLMGFVLQAFDFGLKKLDRMKYWMRTKPTLYFTDPKKSFSNYSDYPKRYKKYFEDLRDTKGAEALMVGKWRDRFQKVANMARNNPNYRKARKRTR